MSTMIAVLILLLLFALRFLLPFSLIMLIKWFNNKFTAKFA
ncbi:MAG: hypothetical protein DHS20C20_31780 [Ardenticatenaceae bacterium]|nr:MAG: hypothetical protein DHS20C20_31780 [Ardenticatenaceae bacterium]